MKTHVSAFVAQRWRVPASAFRVELEPLSGGLESAVALARITPKGRRASLPDRLVVKELRGRSHREARAYAWLWRHVERPPAVRVLGSASAGDVIHLYLEEAQPLPLWPWADTTRAAAVARVLAQLHESARAARLPVELDDNYEEELAGSAESTLQVAREARDAAGRRYWRRLGDLRRVVAALPTIRARLLASDTTLIHGDVHPGNVCLRGEHADPPVVLIDWGRARLGSPLEDIASWLHSLGCWEPQARRRHDTLMRAYLDSRGVPSPWPADLRADYWFASASNGLSGAIRYHLAVLGAPGSTDAARYDSGRALHAWHRVVRRCAAVLNTTPARCM